MQQNRHLLITKLTAGVCSKIRTLRTKGKFPQWPEANEYTKYYCMWPMVICTKSTSVTMDNGTPGTTYKYLMFGYFPIINISYQGNLEIPEIQSFSLRSTSATTVSLVQPVNTWFMVPNASRVQMTHCTVYNLFLGTPLGDLWSYLEFDITF